MKDEAIVGGAAIFMFEDEKDADIVYVGRILLSLHNIAKDMGKKSCSKLKK